MKEFYDNLKQKRIEAGISLDEIQRRSRLQLDYLKAIENGSLEDLPDGYERIYLRRYIQEIGLNGEELMRDLDLLTGRLTPAEAQRKHEQSTKTKSLLPAVPSTLSRKAGPTLQLLERLNLDRIHKVFWIILLSLFILVTGYITYDQYLFEKANEQIQVREITMSEMIEAFQEQDSVLTPEMSDKTINTVSAASRNANVFVQLLARERTWIREIRDQRDTTEYILPAGFERKIEASDQIKFLVGRADGVEVHLNGQNLGVLGLKDQVITSLILNSEGIQERKIKTVVAPAMTPKVDSTSGQNN